MYMFSHPNVQYSMWSAVLWIYGYSFTHAFLLWGPNMHPLKILNYIGRNSLLGNRKKIAKFVMRTFTCRSTFLYAWSIRGKNWFACWAYASGTDAYDWCACWAAYALGTNAHPEHMHQFLTHMLSKCSVHQFSHFSNAYFVYPQHARKELMGAQSIPIRNWCVHWAVSIRLRGKG